jgi:hypothetical protein
LYILSENFYGKPTVGELLSTGVTTDMALLQGILDEMEIGKIDFTSAQGVWMKCQAGKWCEPYLDAYGKKIIKKFLF